MVYANHTNMMNGSTKGSHKVWMGQQQRQQHNQQLHGQFQPYPQQQWGDTNLNNNSTVISILQIMLDS
eukprot:11864294-Ditylum_brightwellii.AAC.1